MRYLSLLTEAVALYANRRVVTLFAFGFSSGLPLLLVLGTLTFWLREAGVGLSEIGYMSWVALAYGVKWLWAPLVDHWALPFLAARLGRRRSWIILSQLLIMVTLLGMSRCDPSSELSLLVSFALLTAFASATQDIVIDAYRIESAPERLQAALAAAYMMGYRIAMILAGAGSLVLAAWFGQDQSYDLRGWQLSYLVMALCMSVGLITALFCHEPEVSVKTVSAEELALAERLGAKLPQGVARGAAFLYYAFWEPFRDFFQTYRQQAFTILALIACYRVADVVMGVMANAFYVDLEFSKSEVATITKVYGVIMTLVGATLGGVLVARFGTLRILLLGSLLTAATNLLFVGLAQVGHNTALLTLIISVDNLSAGIATAAFVSYLSSLTNVAFSATQYALFSSVMMLLPKFLAGFSGELVTAIGYQNFFTFTALLGLPAMGLILWLQRRSQG